MLLKSPFKAFECPFSVFERTFNDFERTFNVFERRFNIAEYRKTNKYGSIACADYAHDQDFAHHRP